MLQLEFRSATGAFRSSPIPSLYAESGMRPPAISRSIKILNFYTRIHINQNHPLHNHLLQHNEDEDYMQNTSKAFLYKTVRLARTFGIDYENIMQEVIPATPPWRSKEITRCTQLYKQKKSSQSSLGLMSEYIYHYSTTHTRSYSIYTDGSKTSDGVGYAFVSRDTEVSKHIQTHASIFTAELLAIQEALEYSERVRPLSVTISTDSRSAIDALCKYMHPNPLVQQIQQRITN